MHVLFAIRLRFRERCIDAGPQRWDRFYVATCVIHPFLFSFRCDACRSVFCVLVTMRSVCSALDSSRQRLDALFTLIACCGSKWFMCLCRSVRFFFVDIYLRLRYSIVWLLFMNLLQWNKMMLLPLIFSFICRLFLLRSFISRNITFIHIEFLIFFPMFHSNWERSHRCQPEIWKLFSRWN